VTRRACFDIACSYNTGRGWLEGPNEARSHFRDIVDEVRKCRFHFWAATVFDDSTQQYADFTDQHELFEFLVDADEIITFNGRKYDLVVLEYLVGEEPAKAIWGKVHHDLTGWRGYWSLEQAAKHLLPEMASGFESTLSERWAELGSPDSDSRKFNDLAGTYRDVKFTYALFLEYLKSGDSDRTFSDIESLMPLEQL
jgi:hypothetical protein